MPLVKWFLAIPHYVVLFFLTIAAFFAVVLAWFAILFTGRYPRGLFDFVEGVLRWHTGSSATRSRSSPTGTRRSASTRRPATPRTCLRSADERKRLFDVGSRITPRLPPPGSIRSGNRPRRRAAPP